jgi:potassium-dependent mechanosensitive channel
MLPRLDRKRLFSSRMLILSLLLPLLFFSQTAQAQTIDIEQLAAQTTQWKKLLDQIDAEIKISPRNDHLLSKIAGTLEKTSIDIKKFVVENKPFADDAKILLDKLGKAPKEGEPPETEAIAKQRKELQRSFTEADSAIRSATSLRVRSGQIREIIHDMRRNLFTSQILEKGKSPFLLSLWEEGIPELSKAFTQIGVIADDWSTRHSVNKLGLLTLVALILGELLFILMQRGILYYRAYPEGPPPPFFKQAASASIVSLMRALPPFATAAFFFGGLHYFDMMSPPIDELAPVFLGAFCTIAAIFALSTTLLAPKRRRWRIFPVSSSVARRLNLLIFAIATVYGVDLFLGTLNTTLLMPLSLTILQSAIASLMFAGLLTAILRTPFKAHKLAGGKGSLSKPRNLTRLLKIPLWGIVFAVLLTTALGYISLARFLTQQTVVTGSILIIAYLAHLTISEFTDRFGDTNKPSGRFLSENFGFSQQRREQLGAVAMLVFNALLALFTLPFLALQWGFSWNDVYSWSRQALFGFEFGGLYISLSAIFIAIILFFLGVLFTRIFQRWLDQKILSKSQSQTGAEDSIKTAVGYLGIVVSALIALSYTGIGFGNIAIVAGALSLGIGFGLQSIVNNFVSGLILLAERPIKVGDWIIVGNDEGNVRRISVRSTEIETFDRSHIIIPNSELISGTVKNWTLRGPLGRVAINVGVSYDSDPDLVHDLLLEVAHNNPSVLEYPASYVVLMDFGASSLDFSLRAYLSDITNSLTVRSQLRFEILRALRKANIEIPFPQTDLHLRDMDRLEKALAQPEQPRGQRNPGRNPSHQQRGKRNQPRQQKKPTQDS